jgi:hypothetical protein
MTLLVVAGVVVFWPALTTPFFLDDYLQSAMVHGRFPVVRGPFSLYDFVGDDDRAALFAQGFLPWWTDTRITLRFLRPLSSALLYYEHTWFDAWPGLMHLHSFAWWIAAVFAARAFFKRLVSPRAAAFATVIFALAPCHALPLGWLANREALIALAFGTVGLTALLRWQKGEGVRWAFVSFGAFVLALLAGEYALGCAGYVLAFAWRAPTDARRRWRGVLLFVVPAVAYLVARNALGYGAEASGFYQDPLRDTWLFLSNAPWRLASLALAGWFSQDATAWLWWGPAEWPVFVVVAVFVIGGVAALRHVTSQLPAEARRTTWTLAWGSMFSLAPMLAVLPSVRLLGVAMLGIAPVVGVILDTAWFGTATEARHGLAEWTAIAATLLGFAHLIHGPVRGWSNARQIREYAVEFREHATELAKRLKARPAADVVVVRGMHDVFFYGFALEALGVRETHWTVLSHTGHVLCLRRDPTSIELVVGADTGLYPASLGDLYRSEAHRLAAGETFSPGGVVATVVEMGAYGPRKARFDFPADIDDPRFVWVGESRVRGFYDATPPKVGFGAPFEP